MPPKKYENDAIMKSISEAYLLGNYYEALLYEFKLKNDDSKELNKLIGNSYSEELNKFFDENTLQYVSNLIEVPTTNQESTSLKENSINHEEFYSMLPSWINQLLICILPQKISEKFIVIKAISDQLYTHIPKKEYLDLNKAINKQTINLTPNELEIIPDCPIV